MKTFNYTIKDELGIHARPAGLLAKVAKEYQSTITLEANGKSADASRLMAVMSLGAKQNAEVTVKAEGADEDAAIEAVEDFFNKNL
jgi:phosphocarrier protein